MGKWLDMLRAETEHETASPQNPQPPETRELDSRVAQLDLPPLKPPSKAAIQKAMEEACIGLPILPGEFRALIDDDEAGWVTTSRIPMKSARAYARLFAEQLARDSGHPVNLGMVTCWACQHHQKKLCLKRREARHDVWFPCNDFREVAQ